MEADEMGVGLRAWGVRRRRLMGRTSGVEWRGVVVVQSGEWRVESGVRVRKELMDPTDQGRCRAGGAKATSASAAQRSAFEINARLAPLINYCPYCNFGLWASPLMKKRPACQSFLFYLFILDGTAHGRPSDRRPKSCNQGTRYCSVLTATLYNTST
jgi:hypothetical protein